ncbi:MAG: hypothetical protein L6R48_12080 [Planctomycetes bacterium]|nr:hypothetical protein [Planctomycetota bacterium]
MATVTVRKFAISPDPAEALDFTEPVDYFAGAFTELGFEHSGTYTFRYSDGECMMKAELTPSKDGYYLWMYVQALDEHGYRLEEVAEAFGAHVVENARRR